MRKQTDYILFTLVISLALFCFVNNPILFSQEQTTQYKVEVKEKLLYVLALNKAGNPVTDLKKEDFQLLLNGKPQEIKTFTLVSYTKEKVKAEEKELTTKKLEIPDHTFKELESKKRFILAVIPYTFRSYYQKWKTEKGLIHLVQKSIRPNDWLGILIIHRDWISTIQDFTSSKEKLLQKINAYFELDKDKFERSKIEYPLTANEILQIPQLPIFQGTIPVKAEVDIIPSLELIAKKLRVLDGRKIILCFGLDLCFIDYIEHPFIKGLKCRNRIKRFYEMIDKMQSNNITLYYTELKKPHLADYYPPSSSVKLDSYNLLPGNPGLPRFKGVQGVLDTLIFYRESSHFALAKETGGKYYYNISSPTYFIDDVLKMNNSYYLLSFPIQEDMKEEKFHNMKLECKRQGVRLYYSNKYYAPHEHEEKKFVESYKRIQLYKYIFIDTTKEPDFDIYGQWITLPSNETNLQTGALDFYLPVELLHRLPISFQLGCSYSDAMEQGIIFQWELTVSSSDKNMLKAAHGYVVRILAKLPEGEKSFRFVAMDSESGKFGRFDIDMSRESGKSNLSNIILGRLVEKKHVFQFQDYSEAQYNLKKDLYNLLSVNDKVIIPSVNSAFNAGENITFCLIHKIPEEQSKQYKNHKAMAYLAPEKEGPVTEIKIPLRIKKVKKRYYQYYGTIDTSNLTLGKYRIEIDLKDANNSIIAATDAYFKIVE
jgi:VWFA-related protein